MERPVGSGSGRGGGGGGGSGLGAAALAGAGGAGGRGRAAPARGDRMNEAVAGAGVSDDANVNNEPMSRSSSRPARCLRRRGLGRVMPVCCGWWALDWVDGRFVWVYQIRFDFAKGVEARDRRWVPPCCSQKASMSRSRRQGACHAMPAFPLSGDVEPCTLFHK